MKTAIQSASRFPVVTVIMPIRNEERYIKDSLGAVLQQDYPKELLQILVVDGMSRDKTRTRISELACEQRAVERIKLLDNPGRIVSTGLNIALSNAQGDIVVRVDGHTVIAPDYVRECVLALQRTEATNVGGRMEPAARGFIGQVVALATSSVFGVGWSRFHYSNREQWVDTVYMGAWRRQTFGLAAAISPKTYTEEGDDYLRYSGPVVGLFDEGLVRAEDNEFNYRLRKLGGSILLTPSIRSIYVNRSRLTDLSRQYFEYGFWKVRVFQKHPMQMSLRQFIPPVFVAAVIAALISFPLIWLGRLAAGGLLVAYTLADIFAAVWIGRRHGFQQTVGLLVAFPILHLSYGLGFIAGIWHFRKFWFHRHRPDPWLRKARRTT